MRFTALCMTLAVTAAIPASAQDNPARTPESAQAFLVQILPMQSAKLSWMGQRGQWNGVWREETVEAYGSLPEEHHRRVVTLSPLRVTRVSSPNRCQTTIAIQPIASRYVPPKNFRSYEYDGSPYGPFTISWKGVSEVYHPDGATEIEIRGATQIKLHLTSAAVATRVAYAMEFLRQNCDPTGGVW